MPLSIEKGIVESQIEPSTDKLTETGILILNRLLTKEIGTEKQRNTMMRIMRACQAEKPARVGKFQRLISALKQQTGRSTL